MMNLSNQEFVKELKGRLELLMSRQTALEIERASLVAKVEAMQKLIDEYDGKYDPIEDERNVTEKILGKMPKEEIVVYEEKPKEETYDFKVGDKVCFKNSPEKIVEIMELREGSALVKDGKTIGMTWLKNLEHAKTEKKLDIKVGDKVKIKRDAQNEAGTVMNINPVGTATVMLKDKYFGAALGNLAKVENNKETMMITSARGKFYDDAIEIVLTESKNGFLTCKEIANDVSELTGYKVTPGTMWNVLNVRVKEGKLEKIGYKYAWKGDRVCAE